MKGKEKCKILKEIRAEIAKANDINWVTENCTHKGECRGTCPKCESEVRALERELERRRMLGKTVVLAGVSASLLVSTMGCDELLYDFTETGGEPSETASKTKLTTVPPLPGDIEVDGDYAPVYPSLSDFESIEEVTYAVRSPLYCDPVEDVDYPKDFDYTLSEGDVFTVIGYYDSWEAYLVRLEDGTLAMLYQTDIHEKSDVLPEEMPSEKE